MSSSLINFNVPIVVRKRFDAVCRAYGRSRTSVLLELMQTYVLSETKRLAEREQELGSLDRYLEVSQGLKGAHQIEHPSYRNWDTSWENQGSQGLDLPTSFFSDGREDW